MLAVNRSYKNENGEYETDYVKCLLWDGIAENTSNYCKKGDIIGVRGRVESTSPDSTIYEMHIVAEKITFLSSKRAEETD